MNKLPLYVLLFVCMSALAFALVTPYPTGDNTYGALVAWTFDDTASDALGSGNGTKVGCVYHTDTPLSSGKSLWCDGTSDDYFDSGFTEIYGNGPFTISFWFNKTAGWNGWSDAVFGSYYGGPTDYWYLYYGDASNGMYFQVEQDSGDPESIKGAKNISGSQGIWQHITLIRTDADVNKMYIYVNGHLEVTSVANTQDTNGNNTPEYPLFFLARNNAGNDDSNTKGTIDDLLIFGQALCAGEENCSIATTIANGNYSTPDTVAPTFDEYPDNISIFNKTAVSIKFNASDDEAVDRFWINDTTNFNITFEGLLINNTKLAINNWTINVSVNDTSGNVNFTLLRIEVNQSDLWEPLYNSTHYVTGGSNVSGNTFMVNISWIDQTGYGVGNLSHWVLTENQTGSWVNHTGETWWNNSEWLIANMSFDITASAGTVVSMYFYANDTNNNWNVTNGSANNAKILINFTVTDATPPTFNESVNNVSYVFNSAFPFIDFNATDDTEFSRIFINDTIRFNVSQRGILKNITNIGVGNYTVNVSINDSFNNLDYVLVQINVTIATPTCTVQVDAVSPLTYPDSVTSGCVCTEFAGYVNHSVNSTEVTNKTVRAGVTHYNLSCSVNGSQNYTANWDSTNFVIQQSADKCDIGSNESLTVNQSRHFNITTNCTSNFYLLRNDSNQFDNGTNFNLTVGQYNFSVYRNDTQNYSNIFDVLTVAVQKGDRQPNVSVIWQTPATNITHNKTDFENYSVQICCYDAECGGINVTLDPTSTANTDVISSVSTSVSSVDADYPLPVLPRQMCRTEDRSIHVVFINESGIKTLIVAKSTDNATTWTYQNLTGFTDADNFVIDCDASTVTVVGDNNTDALVYTSYDYGATYAYSKIDNAVLSYTNTQLEVYLFGNKTYIMTMNATGQIQIFNATLGGQTIVSNYSLITGEDTTDGGSLFSTQDTTRMVVLGTGTVTDVVLIISINDSGDVIQWKSTDGGSTFGAKTLLYEDPIIDMSDNFWCNGNSTTVFCTGTDYGSGSLGDYCLYKSSDSGDNWGAEDCHVPDICLDGTLDSSNSFYAQEGDIYYFGHCVNDSAPADVNNNLILVKHNGSWQTPENLTEPTVGISGEDRYYMPHASRFITQDFWFEGVVTDDDDKNLTYFGVSLASPQGDVKPTVVSNTTGDTPFYTNGSNPQNVTLLENECSVLTFWVNATGTVNNSYIFHTFANQSINNSNSGQTILKNITIGETPVAVDLVAPTFNETPDNVTLEYGRDYLWVDFNASDDFDIGEWFINDSRFNMSSSKGILGNGSRLSVDVYQVNVSVNDTSNNVNFTVIRVTVNDTILPSIFRPDNASVLWNDSLDVVFNGSDLSNVTSFSVSDETNFTINSTGGLKNNTRLTIGNYNITITANDSYNNTNTTSYQIEVVPVNTTHTNFDLDVGNVLVESNTYILIGNFTFNRSTTDQLVIKGGAQASNIGASVTKTLSIRITNGDNILDEEMVTVQGQRRRVFTIPHRNFTPVVGENNITIWAKHNGVAGGVNITEFELDVDSLKSNLNNNFSYNITNVSINFSSTDWVNLINFTLYDKKSASKNILDFQFNFKKLQGVSSAIPSCYLIDNNSEQQSVIISRYLSTLNSVGSAGIVTKSLNDDRPDTKYLLWCQSTTTDNIMVNGTMLIYDSFDIEGNIIQGFHNVTAKSGLSGLDNSILNVSYYPRNPTIEIAYVLNYQSTSGAQEGANSPSFHLNSTGSSCTKRQARSLNDNNDEGVIKGYAICDGLTLNQEANFSFFIDVASGETVDLLNASFVGFESTGLDISTGNTAPSVSIITPLDGSNVSDEFIINWSTVDSQGDNYASNITIQNISQTTVIASNLHKGISNYSWNSTALANGTYNLTVMSCENETAQLFCTNDTHSIFVNNSLVDAVAPTFNETVNNISVVFNTALPYINFNATDDGQFQRYFINDTIRFNISQDGVLINITPLGVDNYTINVSLNDSWNNINFTILAINVTRASSTCSVDTNVTSPIGYPDSVMSGCVCTEFAGTLNHSINGTEVVNNTNTSGRGHYNLSCSVNASQNYSLSISTENFIIQQGTPNLGISITSPIAYPNESTATGTGCPAELTCTLWRNDSVKGSPEVVQLGVGHYNYTYGTSGNANYTAFQAVDTLIVNINTSSCSVEVNATSPVQHPTHLKVGTDCSDTFYLLRNDTVQFDNGTAFNLSVAHYNFSVYRNDSFNYSNTFDVLTMLMQTEVTTTTTTEPIAGASGGSAGARGGNCVLYGKSLGVCYYHDETSGQCIEGCLSGFYCNTQLDCVENVFNLKVRSKLDRAVSAINLLYVQPFIEKLAKPFIETVAKPVVDRFFFGSFKLVLLIIVVIIATVASIVVKKKKRRASPTPSQKLSK